MEYHIYLLKDPDLLIPKYIGITNNVERRFNEHINDPHFTKKTKWISELKKGGKLPVLEVLFTTTDVQKAIQKEIDLIKSYSENYVLVNGSSGGEYKLPSPIDVYELDGTFIASYDSISEYCELAGLNYCCSNHISQVCRKLRNYAYGKIYRYSGEPVTKEDLERLQASIKVNDFGINKSKEVYVFNIEGDLLGHFPSINKACQAGFGDPHSIGMILRGSHRTCSSHGYLFCSREDGYNEAVQRYLAGVQNKKEAKWVCQYNLDGTFVRKHKSAYAARNYLGKTGSSISQCLRGVVQKAYGYMWRYSNTFESIAPYKSRYNRHLYSKPVSQYTLDNKLIATYISSKDAAKAIGGNAAYIKDVASGNKNNTHKAYGYIWRYNGGRLVKRLT